MVVPNFSIREPDDVSVFRPWHVELGAHVCLVLLLIGPVRRNFLDVEGALDHARLPRSLLIILVLPRAQKRMIVVSDLQQIVIDWLVKLFESVMLLRKRECCFVAGG